MGIKRWLACALALAACYVGGPEADRPDVDDEDAAQTDDGASEASTGGDDSDGGDDGGPSPLDCEGPRLGPSRMPRLTQAQYANAVFDLLGVTVDVEALTGDEHVGPFDANVAAPVGTLQLRQYMQLADDAGALAVDHPAVVACAAEPDAADCAGAFVLAVAHRAYGRPLTDPQRARLDAVFEAGLVDGVPAAVSLAIAAVLQNPYFLYGVATGTPDPEDPARLHLDGASIARRMALLLWGSVADVPLLDAAADGALADPDGRRAQAERMLDDPRAERALGRRYAEWFGVADLPLAPKDPAVFPDYDAALAQDMTRAFATFAARIVLDGGTVNDLLVSRRAFVSPALAAWYGVAHPAGEGDAEVLLPDDERAGLLTRAGLMARWAHQDQTAPVHRGALVRADVLCQPNPPPPPDVDDAPVEVDPDATAAERFAMHREDPVCNACHERLDLVGFGFEHYDGVGRYRTVDGNVAVDARGALLHADVEGEFEGAVELSTMLAGSEEVRRCFIRQHVRLSQLREIAASEATPLRRHRQAAAR